jgi:hypothetical protein
MKLVSVGLVAALALAGCVTTPVASVPITGLEAEVFNVILDDAFAIATAEQLAEDCPGLGFNEAQRRTIVDRTVVTVVDKFNGDVVRAERLVKEMQRRLLDGVDPAISQRLLAYIKANDYLPGDAAAACRVGEKELRNGTLVGQMLRKQ